MNKKEILSNLDSIRDKISLTEKPKKCDLALIQSRMKMRATLYLMSIDSSNE